MAIAMYRGHNIEVSKEVSRILRTQDQGCRVVDKLEGLDHPLKALSRTDRIYRGLPSLTIEEEEEGLIGQEQLHTQDKS